VGRLSQIRWRWLKVWLVILDWDCILKWYPNWDWILIFD
jgi:hypothetical protein